MSTRERLGDIYVADVFGESCKLGVDQRTHEVVLVLETAVGALRYSMPHDRAMALAVAIIRVTGQQYDFSREMAARLLEEVADNARVPSETAVRNHGAAGGDAGGAGG
jgi:hypothetical protein